MQKSDIVLLILAITASLLLLTYWWWMVRLFFKLVLPALLVWFVFHLFKTRDMVKRMNEAGDAIRAAESILRGERNDDLHDTHSRTD